MYWPWMKYADIGMATHDANALSPAMAMNSIYTLEALDYGSIAIEVLGVDRATIKCVLPGTSKKKPALSGGLTQLDIENLAERRSIPHYRGLFHTPYPLRPEMRLRSDRSHQDQRYGGVPTFPDLFP